MHAPLSATPHNPSGSHHCAGLDPPAWSPPVFYKVLEGSIGFTAGDRVAATGRFSRLLSASLNMPATCTAQLQLLPMARHAPGRVEAHRCASTALQRRHSRGGVALATRLGTYCGVEKLLMHTLGWAAEGAGGSSTLIALGTDAAVEAFCSGKAVLGDDFSLSLGAAPDPT